MNSYRRSDKRSIRRSAKKLLSQAMSLITDEAPAQFMWRHQLLFGMAKNIDYRPLPSERILRLEYESAVAEN